VELEEIMGLSDRIAVMFDGRIMGERLPGETSEGELGLLMAGMESAPADRPLHEAVEERLATQAGEVR
jgi:simple sugar transport system ATP-binding protein